MAADNRSQIEHGSGKNIIELDEEINDISTDSYVDNILPANEYEGVVNQEIEEINDSHNDNVSIVLNDKELKDRDYVYNEESKESVHSPDENVENFNLSKREGSKRTRKPQRV